MLSSFYILIFVLSVIYLVRYRLNIKKAAEISDKALFPENEAEFASLVIPTEWKEMVRAVNEGHKILSVCQLGYSRCVVLVSHNNDCDSDYELV